MAVTTYCTLDELHEHIGDTGSVLPDGPLQQAIDAASRWIDSYCGRRFWLDDTAQVRLYRPDDPCRTWIDDIGTATGLVIKTDTGGDGTWATTWASTDYQLEPLNAPAGGSAYSWRRIAAIGSLLFPVSARRPTLQITARFGWSAVPDAITEACLLRAAMLYKRRDAPLGVAGFGDFGPVRVARNDPHVTELLAPFMLPGFA
ncbi:hypothetical protein [Microtetraspora malaysiensis]|uniref:hypothetical protein n=1 Tax=Microtetraspora malaysiensis TaxID=161358 RepID=UPI003D8D59CA